MKNIFILGGSGFVGSHVCEKLARQGHQLTVATRRRRNAQHLQHLPGLTVVELDVHDGRALSAALAGHDVLINLVAILHGTAQQFERVHVALPKTIAQACCHNAVAQVVHISALGADALQPTKAPSMYLRSKGEGEAVLLQAAQGAGAGELAGKGFDLSILRPSVIFGAEDQFINLFAKLQRLAPVMPLAGANARFQPVWVQDVAQAVVCCVQGVPNLSSPRTLEACGPDVFTLRQLVQLAGCLSGAGNGRGRPVIALPDWAGRLQASLMSLLPGEPLMSVDNLDSMRRDNVATPGHAGLKLLGIDPAPLEPVAREFLRP
ncbi:MAG: complex I NDUFA9 subunit family protein [Rhodoferax sp.]